MDTLIMDTLVSHAIVAGLGAIIGAVVTYLILARSKSGRSAAQAQAELERYRERVADHFARTAALVDQLTDSYKDVFDQLQAGATELLDPDTLREKLAHQSAEVITLNRLGYRSPERPPADAVAEDDERGETPAAAEGGETPETSEPDEKPERSEREKPEASEPGEKPEKSEPGEKPEKSEPGEAPETSQRGQTGESVKPEAKG